MFVQVAGAGRSFHLAEDAHLRRDGQHALQAVAEIRELLYQAFQLAHRGDRLHYGHYGVHTSAAAPDTSAPSTLAPSTSAPATSAPSTSVTPPHTTPYISADSLDVLPTQHTGIPYVPDPDWTPPRYMHGVVTPPTQLPPPDSSTATMSTHDAVLTEISHVDAEAHIEPPLDVAAEVGVRAEAEAEAEVEVQLQIVIQLHQMMEFHSSQQYLIFGHRQDQG
ncbi:hypothetical protein ACSBR1_036194 [Camellia fascicularis]